MAGSTDDVLQGYIQNSPASFGLTADNILYLKDLGISSAVTSAMLNRDAALRGQPQAYNYNQTAYAPTIPPPAAPAPAPAPEAAAPVTPTAAPVAVVSPAPVYVSSPPVEVTYFYTGLSPYGTWVELPGYGWCWQPTTVALNRGWSPYCDGGHWVYTDAGWYWASDYSWGWAPFHYGRWLLHEHHGWVWLPDRVWGPAWVTWRTADTYCGWAPLPPHADFDVRLGWSFNGVHVGLDFDFGLHSDHFTFISLDHFNDHDLGHRRLPPAEVTRVYNRTTVINYTVNNTTIVNRGVPVDRVAAVTHTEIHKTVIRDVSAGSPQVARTQPGQKEPVIYRPQLQAPARPVPMVAQKLDKQHPEIQHPIAKPSSQALGPQRTETSRSTISQPATRTSTGAAPPATASTVTPRAPVHLDAPKSPTPSTAGTALPRPASTAPAKADLQATPSTQGRPATASGAPTYPKAPTITAPAAPNAVRSTDNLKASPSAPTRLETSTAAKPTDSARAPSHPPALTRPQSAAQLPSISRAPATPTPVRTVEQDTSHVYQPKSAHQAADIHALPPLDSSHAASEDSSPKKHSN
jgi:hypothetical protein